MVSLIRRFDCGPFFDFANGNYSFKNSRYNTFWLKHFDEGKAEFYMPNAGHEALARICQAYPTTTKVITQNIDRLHSHSHAKISDEQLIEIHGSHGAFKCFTEDCPYSNTELYHGKLHVRRSNVGGL